MWRILTAGLIGIAGIALARVAIAAPGPKDPPKKDSPIVGEWQMVSIDGQQASATVYEFRANGDLMIRAWFGTTVSEFKWQYATDERPDPPQIDLTFGDARHAGIFKIDGARLTICYRVGRGQRPKKFGEKGAIEEVFERVKKD
jgi:uncharacterized protein (TIGR03067 family)